MLYLVLTVGLSVIYTWLYNSTGGAILMPMIFHGAVNLGLGWYPLGEGLLPIMVLGAVVWGVSLLIIAIYGPAKLANMRPIGIAGLPGEAGETPGVASGDGRASATGTSR